MSVEDFRLQPPPLGHHGNGGGRTVRKSFDINAFKEGLAEDLLERSPGLSDILQSLQDSHLWKVRSASKWFRRKFTLDINAMTVRYEPTYKYNTCIGKEKKQIDLGDIVDVRKGWKTDVFNAVGAKEEKKRAKNSSYKPEVDEKSCFSIIYGPRQETMDLVAPNEEIADRWVRALQALVSAHRSAAQEQSYELWLRKQFNAADIDKNKCLNFPETMKLLKQMNIVMEESQARQLFNTANTKKNERKGTIEVLDENEFVDFYFKLLQRPELEKLFNTYAGAGGVLSPNELCQFLQKEQGGYESISVEEASELIKIYEQAELSKNSQMSLAGFTNMLLSPKFDIFDSSHRIVHHDMTQPLTNYYIAASHNTYLVGNQLSGASSVEGYIAAFERGCRCVELDCWDGDDDEPIIYHGYTLTTKIRFKEVLSDAVKPFAFIASQYPVILNIENHCSEPYQKKMAHHLKTILGDMLYTEEVDPNLKTLPSPEQLKYKVILRAKRRAGASFVDSAVASGGSGPNSPSRSISEAGASPTRSVHSSANEDAAEGQSVTASAVGIDDGLIITDDEPPRASVESLDESYDSDMEDSIDYIDGEDRSPKRKNVTADLSALVNILQGTHFHSFEDAKDWRPYQTCSFPEAKALKLISEEGAEFVEFNKRQISRIFPAGSRTTSSNFNPIVYWTAGCQLVTLNYQTEDVPNFYNWVQFTENGHCGYLLKPEILRNPSINFDPNAAITSAEGAELVVQVISGQHLPKAPGKSEVVDPYVEVRVKGLAQDSAKHSTKVVRNNGFNPMWNDAPFKFRVRCPDLAILLFRVYDYSQTGTDSQLAHYGIPLSAVATGYRHVHLVSIRGTSLAPSSLFVHIRFNRNGSPIK